jgi:predicted phage terminase large subunit-like protein
MPDDKQFNALGLITRTPAVPIKYCPEPPTAHQLAFLSLVSREALYGGSAGGGKSSALLMAALQYVNVPGYAALLFRKTYADLAKPGALMDRAADWLSGSDAKWNQQDKQWLFPSGATINFGYLDAEKDKYNYQGGEYQFIGFDEATQFSESQYRYLLSRLRRKAGVDIPLRMRLASNPGGAGHEWVRQRFVVEGRANGRPFIPARLEDNPGIDQDEYRKSLDQLDHLTRAQLLNGDWDVLPAGGLFRREWFTEPGRIVDVADVPKGGRSIRYWDLAATVPKPGKDPDWTAGAKVTLKDGVYYIEDIKRKQGSPMQIEKLVRETADIDGKSVAIRMEQEGGASGVNTIDTYSRRVLVGFDFQGHRKTGDKSEMARPVSAAAEQGNVRLVRGAWIGPYLDEVEAFPQGMHDDQVDAVSGAFSLLSNARQTVTKVTPFRI